MTATVESTDLVDSGYAWRRLAAAVALSAFGGVGMWSVVVALPTVQAEFGLDRGEASVPYTLTMVGFALGGVMMGRIADRFGIFVPLMSARLRWRSGTSLPERLAALRNLRSRMAC